MIVDLYEELTSELATNDDVVALLQRYHVEDIFKDIIGHYQSDTEGLKKAVLYILHMYSKNSRYHQMSGDWMLTKTKVCKDIRVKKTDQLYTDLVELNLFAIRMAAGKYIDYQQSKPLSHLAMLEDLYQKLINYARVGDKDAPQDAVNFKKMKEAALDANQIYSEIGEWEQRLASELGAIKIGIEETKQQPVNSLRVEDNLD